MNCTVSIAQAGERVQVRIDDLEDMLAARCPYCGNHLGVDLAHIGGHSRYMPVAVCDKGTHPGHYYIANISEKVYRDYLEEVA